ncbi:MAG: hypothetical protein AAGA80_16440 [Cyanobacteria bacterium P01_F01_bin.143]
MDKNDEHKRKVKKFWQIKLTLAIGFIGSSCLLLFVVKGLFQTSKEHSVPQTILNMKAEIKPILKSLGSSEGSLVERKKDIKKMEDISKKYNLEFSHHWSSTLFYVMLLEQTLSSQNDLSENELKELIKNIDISLWNSFKSSLLEKYFARCLKRDFERDLERHFEPYFEKYFERDLDQYLFRYLKHDFEQYLNQYLELDFAQYFKRDFVKQLIQTKWWLFLAEQGESPKIKREDLKQISQSIIEEINKALELEMSQKYGLDLTIYQDFLTTEKKQVKLIQFSMLAILSITVLMLSLLFLIRQRNQGVTWSMTGMYLFPEECISELEARYERLKSDEDNSAWEIRLIMLWEILILLKSIYIQVAIEDLFLPSKNKRD